MYTNNKNTSGRGGGGWLARYMKEVSSAKLDRQKQDHFGDKFVRKHYKSIFLLAKITWTGNQNSCVL